MADMQVLLSGSAERRQWSEQMFGMIQSVLLQVLLEEQNDKK